MKKKLFGSFGDSVKGNAVIAVLVLCVIGAAGLSIHTVNDINNKLNNQKIENPQPDISSSQEQTKDVQKEADNVPLKPAQTPKPKEEPKKPDTAKETETKAENVPKEEPKETGFMMPVAGKICAAFSADELIYNKTLGDWRTHNGIDIRANKDVAVKAGMSGIVKDIYIDGMLGNVVEVESNDVIVRYCGLGDNILVKKGNQISQGESIGVVGDIPLETSDESHLHIEFIKNGQYQNPNNYLSSAN